MPIFQMPAINQTICQSWPQQAVDTFQKYPFWLAKTTVEVLDTWSIWPKVTGSIKWKPNMGTTMRGTRLTPSPNLRQFAFPNPIQQNPKVDLIGLRDTSVNELIYSHEFRSQYINFIGDFQDFMGSSVEPTREDIQKKIARFGDVFTRGKVLHRSPFVWIPNRVTDLNGEGVPAPYSADGSDDGSTGKTTAWFQARVAEIGQPGNLSLDTISRLLPFLSTSIGAPVFMGSNKPANTGGLTGKYLLIISDEAYSRFAFDPYVKANRALDLNIITEGFTGDLWGRVTCKLEDKPLRLAADGTFPAPETREENPAMPNYGETVPNPAYTEITNAPYEIAFIVGSSGYDTIDVGPPPSAFSGSGLPDGFGKMTWNGEIMVNKNLLIECIKEDGTKGYDPNSFGRFLQLQSWVTYGCVPKQPRYIVPIIFKRIRGNGGTTGT